MQIYPYFWQTLATWWWGQSMAQDLRHPYIPSTTVLGDKNVPLHNWSWYPTCVQSFSPVPFTVFDLQGLKPNKQQQQREEDKLEKN